MQVGCQIAYASLRGVSMCIEFYRKNQAIFLPDWFLLIETQMLKQHLVVGHQPLRLWII